MRFWSLEGLVPYAEVSELQKRLVDLRARDACPDTVLFLEHLPVITRGRGLQFTGVERPRHMPFAEGMLPPGMQFAESERGGDLTYHGPGQLVMYPILKLDGQGFAPARDIAAFLRKIEQVFIDLLQERLASAGMTAGARSNATGVWIGDRKVASLGIAIRKWVSYHGIAINVVNDLKPFHLISPCGFAPEVMMRLNDLPGAVPEGEGRWRSDLEEGLVRKFAAGLGQSLSSRSRTLSLAQARAELSDERLTVGLESGRDFS